MKIYRYMLMVGLLISQISFSQKYISTQSSTSFFSETPVENIEATSTKGKSILDLSTGNVVFSIAISSFEFEKSLMQEHFNEKYMESDKFPKAVFKGNISGFDINGEGIQKVESKGELTIHGVTKEISQVGEMHVQNGKITIDHSFKVAIKDYKIKIPKLLWQNIAEIIDIKLTFEYEPYEK